MTMRSEEHGTSPAMFAGADALAARSTDVVLLAGRLLIGWIFVQSGFGKLMNMSGFAATMPRRGLPEFMGYIAAPVEFFGGLAIMLGFASRYAALLILLFTIIATFSSHRYWQFPAEQVQAQQSNFMKNLSIMGGLLLLFVTGAGRFSLDAMLGKRSG